MTTLQASSPSFPTLNCCCFSVSFRLHGYQFQKPGRVFLDPFFQLAYLNLQMVCLLVQICGLDVSSLRIPWERLCPAIDRIDFFEYHPSLLQQDAHVDTLHDYTLHKSVLAFHRVGLTSPRLEKVAHYAQLASAHR